MTEHTAAPTAWAVATAIGPWIPRALYLVVYLACSLACVRAAPWPRRARAGGWLEQGSLLAVLGLFRMGDCARLVTQRGRALAASQGWYADRRVLQAAMVAWVIIGFAAFARWCCRGRSRCHLAAPGTALLLALLALETISYHWTDALFAWRVGGLSVSRLAEGIGLAWVFTLAASAVRRGDGPRSAPALSTPAAAARRPTGS